MQSKSLESLDLPYNGLMDLIYNVKLVVLALSLNIIS